MSNATHAMTEPHRERSRNAKAQARHRAKRKAYIESLEQTVTALQQKLGIPNDDLGILPPASAKIHDLELENAQLKKENEELRQMLNHSPPRSAPRTSLPEYRPSAQQGFPNQPDQQRKLPALSEESSYSHHSGNHDSMTRPPSLHIPTNNTHYSNAPPQVSASSSSSTTNYSLGALRIPETPTASNASEPASPSYSPTTTTQYPHAMTYSTSGGNSYHPPPIKMEEPYDGQYQSGPNRYPHQMNYSHSMPSFSHPGWHHGYTAER